MLLVDRCLREWERQQGRRGCLRHFPISRLSPRPVFSGIIPGSSRGGLYGFVNHRDTSPAAIARAVVGHDALDGCAERAEEGGAASREGRAGVAEQRHRRPGPERGRARCAHTTLSVAPLLPNPLGCLGNPRGEPPRLLQEGLRVLVGEVPREGGQGFVARPAPPERLERLDYGAGGGRAAEEVAVCAVPQLDLVRPVGIGLVGAAAHVDVARGDLGVEPQRVERRVPRRRDDPLVRARHRADHLVHACGDLGAEQLASLRDVVDAAEEFWAQAVARARRQERRRQARLHPAGADAREENEMQERLIPDEVAVTIPALGATEECETPLAAVHLFPPAGRSGRRREVAFRMWEEGPASRPADRAEGGRWSRDNKKVRSD